MQRIRTKDFFDKLFMLLIFSVVFISVSNVNVLNFNIDIFVIISFIIVGMLSLISILKCKRAFSLNKTYWYFVLIFFFIAPFIQYLTNNDVWGYRFHISNIYYLKTNIIVILSEILHMYLYHLNNKIGLDKNSENINFINNGIKKSSIRTELLLTFLSLMCLIVLIKNVGFINLFSRTTNSTELSENSMFNTIFTCFIKVIPVYVFTYIYSIKNKNSILSIINLVFIVIMNFPTSTTRFWMGAIYIGIVLKCYVERRISTRKRIYDIILLLTFTIIFPISYSFKFHSIDYFFDNGIKLEDLSSSYNTVDYDAYSIFARSYKHVDENGPVFGKQLIGTILFFVPRSIWKSKPFATGAFIAEAQGQKFTNISCPLLAEGMVNFGLIGSVVFEVIFTIICKKLDDSYWSLQTSNRYLKYLYPYLVGLLLFYLRGALHHAVVYTFCFCIPLIFIWFKDLIFLRKYYEVKL